MTKKIEFKESVAILLIMLIILGSGVIGFGLSPQVPVLTVIAFLVFWLALRHVSWDDIMKGITKGSQLPSFPSLSLF
jgi:NhaC family Na+:H+ antiporter